MLNLWILYTFLFCSILQIYGDDDIGSGEWDVHYIKKCYEEGHTFKFDISKRKINRTHDGYSGKLIMNEPFTEDYGICIYICKHVDGGCKRYQVITEDSSVNFMKKYAKDNVRKCLELAEIEPADFPIAAGEYELEDFVFDYTELPEKGIYGVFGAKVVLLVGTVEVSCVELELEFKKQQECEDEDCEDEK